MITANNPKSDKKKIDVLRQIILPACILFTAVVFIFYTLALVTGTPVLDKEFSFREEYNGNSEAGMGSTQVASDPQNNALSINFLVGILLYALTTLALTQIKRLGYGRLMTMLLHFAGSTVAFFVFVLVFGGYITDPGFGPSMAVTVAYAFFYWVTLGLKHLASRLCANGCESFKAQLRRWVPLAFGVFTVILFVITAVTLIGELKVTTRFQSDTYWDPMDDSVQIKVYSTIINPLAPTFNNYLRYLGTAAVLVLGIAMLFTKLNAVVKVLINFVIVSGGLILLWPLQLDYFRLDVLKENLLMAVIIYLALYVAVLIATAVVLFIRKRRKEDTEEYEAQFTPAKKGKRS